MIDLATPTAVVCHDAGATNLILGWLKADGGLAVRAFMQGPAAALWRAAFPGQPLCGSLEEALDDAKSLLSGTGWASALEHQARRWAHVRGIHSVAVLDHWVNYAPRFERDGQVQWPDEVWVADADALALAHQALPGLPVRQLDNLYLAEQVRYIGPPPGNGTVLIVLEPVRNTWGRGQEGEFQALDYLFDHLGRLWPTGVTQVMLRPHPSESADKYQAWLARHPLVCIDTSPGVAEAISRADVVVGVESFALTIALAACRPVYSSLPPWAPPLRLPHAGIQQIRHLSQL
jgi:hypothetical protein